MDQVWTPTRPSSICPHKQQLYMTKKHIQATPVKNKNKIIIIKNYKHVVNRFTYMHIYIVRCIFRFYVCNAMSKFIVKVGHFMVHCTTLNTLPSHIEIPFSIYILPTLIHKITIYLYTLCCYVYEIWPLASLIILITFVSLKELCLYVVKHGSIFFVPNNGYWMDVPIGCDIY